MCFTEARNLDGHMVSPDVHCGIAIEMCMALKTDRALPLWSSIQHTGLFQASLRIKEVLRIRAGPVACVKRLTLTTESGQWCLSGGSH